MYTLTFLAALLAVILPFTGVYSAEVPKMKMTTEIPADITTPDTVETRLGTLKFFDGLPDQATVQKMYDNLDFMRGVDVFLNTMAATSTLAQYPGLQERRLQ
jgi:hypothetical protein